MEEHQCVIDNLNIFSCCSRTFLDLYKEQHLWHWGVGCWMRSFGGTVAVVWIAVI